MVIIVVTGLEDVGVRQCALCTACGQHDVANTAKLGMSMFYMFGQFPFLESRMFFLEHSWNQEQKIVLDKAKTFLGAKVFKEFWDELQRIENGR